MAIDIPVVLLCIAVTIIGMNAYLNFKDNKRRLERLERAHVLLSGILDRMDAKSSATNGKRKIKVGDDGELAEE